MCERERERESVSERARARASDRERKKGETDSIYGYTYMVRMHAWYTHRRRHYVRIYVLHHKTKQHNDIISFNTVQ